MYYDYKTTGKIEKKSQKSLQTFLIIILKKIFLFMWLNILHVCCTFLQTINPIVL